jgi:RNA polymerase sigma-70 factor (ECF subfamily)
LEDYIETLTFESEESSEIFEAVMKLPEKYRIVIHLFYYEDYSVNEIADILKITPGNVKVRLSRGRMSLRNTLKEVWEDDE